jgi:hypothetical protein
MLSVDCSFTCHLKAAATPSRGFGCWVKPLLLGCCLHELQPRLRCTRCYVHLTEFD